MSEALRAKSIKNINLSTLHSSKRAGLVGAILLFECPRRFNSTPRTLIAIQIPLRALGESICPQHTRPHGFGSARKFATTYIGTVMRFL